MAKKVRISGLDLPGILLAGIVVLPLLLVFSGWLQPQTEVWQHLAGTILADLIVNTLVLMAGVAGGVLLLGVGLAWLVVMYEFPGRKIFEWALMLPLAMPAYVLAFVAVGMLDFSGPLQTLLRDWFGSSQWFFQIRSTGGVILVMTLVLYPYVYMLARSAFLTQGIRTLEASRSLGLNAGQAFFRVALPLARPAIVAGTSLALMETLADFGAVSVFNYDTFTTAIYKAWFGLFNLQAASQLASLLLILVVFSLGLESRLRGRRRYHESGALAGSSRSQLHGWSKWLATGLAGVVLLLAFVIPVIQLLIWSFEVIDLELDSRYLDLLWHTLLLGVGASLLAVIAATVLSIAGHPKPKPVNRLSARLATLGYAMPGSVLAVGIIFSVTAIDNVIHSVSRLWGNESSGLIVSGSVLALLMAYLVRFLAVAYGPVETGLQRIKPGLLEAARSLGCHSGGLLRRIYLPMLRPGLLTALLLVMVDVMKEMPITLLLRPFGWDTLAVRIYEMTSEGEWQRAALPAVTLLILGLLPVILLVMKSRQKESKG